MKILSFRLGGEHYEVNQSGHIKTDRLGYFSENWKFLGATKHHVRASNCYIDIRLDKAFEKPELLNGCLMFDVDHGTTRLHLGSWCGKLLRISGASVKNI